jgi:hypothetical protein
VRQHSAVLHKQRSHACTTLIVRCACRYISALLLSLSTMLHLELPHVNVLSKVDLVPQYGQLGEWFLLFYCACFELPNSS